MAISVPKIRRWWLMLRGKSVWHVNQSIGTCFETNSIRGYYNDLTEKVTLLPALMETDALPLLPLEDGTNVEMPVAIFQYGLGAYDLYLQTGDNRYLSKFKQTVEWAVKHQGAMGRWSTFFYIYPDNPYGAMSQGEGASLLLRAYSQYHNSEYLNAAKKAIDYMLLSVTEGGTTEYKNNDVFLKEYTHLPIVMNGWIFAWWGLYDYVTITRDNGYYKEILDKSCLTLVKSLPCFKTAYWSKYDMAGRIASPFYHNLHIAQMQAMYKLTGIEIFNEYALRWENQQKNPFYKSLAFIKKAFQKIVE